MAEGRGSGLIVVRIGKRRVVEQKLDFILLIRNCLKCPRRLVEIVEGAEVGAGPLISKAEGALAEIKIIFNEPQHRTEVVAQIVDVPRWSVCRDEDQRDTEAHLVGALRKRQKRR